MLIMMFDCLEANHQIDTPVRQRDVRAASHLEIQIFFLITLASVFNSIDGNIDAGDMLGFACQHRRAISLAAGYIQDNLSLSKLGCLQIAMYMFKRDIPMQLRYVALTCEFHLCLS